MWIFLWKSLPVYFAMPWLIAVFIGVIGLAFVPRGDRAIAFITGLLNKSTRRSWLAIGIVGIAVLILCGLPWAIGKVRPPEVHDEISYLLQADTFLHGRLTNPTPQFWRNFQTFHELMTPTYQSKFPVGQGLALAIGKLIGSFNIGAFGTVALASMATCWVCIAVMPRRWALIAGLIAGLHPIVFHWGQTFWGGGVAMLGGALLSGSALRLAAILRAKRGDVVIADATETSNRSDLRWPLVTASIIGAVGYGLLIHSRPLEGTMLAVLLLGWLIVSARLNRDALIALWLRAVPIGLLGVLPFLAFMAHYNKVVTLDRWTLPYAVHSQQYMHSPLFWWQSPHEPTMFRIPLHMQVFFDSFERGEWEEQRTATGFIFGIERKVLFIARDAFVPIAMLVVLLAGGWFALRESSTVRLAAVVCVGLLTLHMLITPWLRTQYLAPIVPLFVLALTASIRAMNRWRPSSRPIGSAAAAALVLTLAIGSLVSTIHVANEPLAQAGQWQEALDKVSSVPGKHLIFVNYIPGEQELYEWVHNSADIDSQRVIWLHPLDEETARHVGQYYSDRTPWELNVRGANATLRELQPFQ